MNHPMPSSLNQRRMYTPWQPLATFCLTTLLLTGCWDIDESTGTTPKPPATPDTVTIQSVGISPFDWDDGQANINPWLDQGLFTIDWKLQATDPYRLDITIETPGLDQPLVLVGFNGGSNRQLYRYGFQDSIDCQWTSNNHLYCGDSPAYPGLNLTDVIEKVPQPATLTVTACNVTLDGLSGCQSRSLLIALY